MTLNAPFPAASGWLHLRAVRPTAGDQPRVRHAPLMAAGYERIAAGYGADHLIGRAAALLLLAAGVKAVYGEVMSEEAHRLLSDAGVRV